MQTAKVALASGTTESISPPGPVELNATVTASGALVIADAVSGLTVAAYAPGQWVTLKSDGEQTSTP